MKTKLLIVLSLALAINAQAGSATWNLNPGSSNWGTASNWTPATIPNGPADTATFAVSNDSDVSILGDIEVNEIVFNPGASAFTITSLPTSDVVIALTISGNGVSNQSGTGQNLVAGFDQFQAGRINFTNSATAGSGITYTALTNPFVSAGGMIQFLGISSAENATFVLQPENSGNSGSGQMYFAGNATAANATISNQGAIFFLDNATAANAVFTNNKGFLDFLGSSSAGNAVVTQYLSSVQFDESATAANGMFTIEGSAIGGKGAGAVHFGETATAGNGIFFLEGATVENAGGALVQFNDKATAGDATFTLAGGAFIDGPDFPSAAIAVFVDTSKGGNATLTANGGTVVGAKGATVEFTSQSSFRETPTAANATLIANSGVAGATGGTIQFRNDSRGGTSRIELFGNGSLDISSRFTVTTVSIGSLEGNGLVFLGAKTLAIGANNLSTIFSGTAQDEGGVGTGTQGSVSKIGNGTLTLSGANTYTGNTTISSGALVVNNTTGSGTGTSVVTATGGTLGGKGIISGAVTVGTGSGSGAFLAPAFGSNKQVTLTLQSSLTLQTDATYTYTFKARANQTRADLVRANGVTINGATIELQGTTQGTLTPGTELTLIRNTSPNPIVGTFGNLTDGAIVTINGNQFQVSYNGGDGNDLTLTVVP